MPERYVSSPTMRKLAVSLVLVLCAAGCKDKSGGARKQRTADEVKRSLEGELAKVNEAVPEPMREKLTFVAAIGEKGRTVMVQPKDWERDVLGGVRPKDASPGDLTSFSVGSNCDGMCEPKAWASIVEKVDFGPYRSAQSGYTIEREETVPFEDGNAKLLLATGTWANEPSKILVVSIWNDKEPRYFTCRVKLQGEWIKALPAFEKACRATKVASWSN